MIQYVLYICIFFQKSIMIMMFFKYLAVFIVYQFYMDNTFNLLWKKMIFDIRWQFINTKYFLTLVTSLLYRHSYFFLFCTYIKYIFLHRITFSYVKKIYEISLSFITRWILFYSSLFCATLIYIRFLYFIYSSHFGIHIAFFYPILGSI